MHDKLFSAIRHMTEFGNQLKENAMLLRTSNFTSEEFLEGVMIKNLTALPINGNVCAVDSGLLSHSMHGVDILLLRTVAVNFLYHDSELVSCSYYPSKVPLTEIEVKTALDEHESSVWCSIVRLKNEISMAISAIENFSPSILLLDGSILPLAKDRPSNDSAVFQEYNELIMLYKKLYNLCKEKNILLIGIIKDSRGRRFVDVINNINCNDSAFLDHLLNKGERTSVMRYAHAGQPILKDLEEFANNIYVSYMKVSDNDLPLRIEFLEFSGNSRDVAEGHTDLNFDNIFDNSISAAYSLSAISDNYAYPAILTEVDLCAALDGYELERLKHSLVDFKPMRRNSRPFR
ncbi:DNA double-strand break repair nuclease NurA [Candidatus Micrarchaeota archaeon]|nr:DNA double-strand break repair nuclease NurA [Candidatus Micrarchaeota archaeon]